MAEGVAGQQDRRAPAGSTVAHPDEVPWSELGEDFIDSWGHDDDGKVRHEHAEVMGQSGGGKSYAIATIMQQRAKRWGTGSIAVITKNTDDSMPLLGWPQVGSWPEARKYQWSMFWPQTRAVGEDREAFHEKALYDLLSNLWPDPGEQAHCVLYLDECRYLENLRGPSVHNRKRLRSLMRQYWREGRSHGISLIAGAQRPLEMLRDQHSESRWKLVFPPADEADMERFAEMLGPWKEWAPVLRGLDQQAHQFVLRNTFTRDTYITWIDRDLRPLPSQVNQKPEDDHTPSGAHYGRAKHKPR